jgi:hypothetical protein
LQLTAAERDRVQLAHEIRLRDGFLFDARSVCRIGIYNASSCLFIEQGSGFVVDREHGLVVTAAHLVCNPITLEPRYVFGPSSAFKIILGLVESEVAPPRWSLEAEVVASGCTHTGLHGRFIDAMVLRVTQAVVDVTHTAARAAARATRATSSTGASKPDSTLCGRVELRCDGDAALPLAAFLELGDSESVRLNDEVTLLGFALRKGAESIVIDRGKVNGFTANKDDIHTAVYNHSGSSGGPLLDSGGRVIALMSKSANNLGCYVSSNRFLPLLDWVYKHVNFSEKRGVSSYCI